SSLSVTEPVKVFPGTHPPPIPAPNSTAKQRVEQGLAFLRDSNPGLDVPIEVLEPLMLEAHYDSLRPAAYDPLAGDTMVSFTVDYEGLGRSITALAFAGGECGNGLCVSPFEDAADGTYALVACEAVLYDCETPIYQLATPSQSTGGAPILAIRTQTKVVCGRLLPRDTYSKHYPTPIVFEEIGTLEVGEDIELAIVDMQFCSPVALDLIDQAGQVWRWEIKEDRYHNLVMVASLHGTSEHIPSPRSGDRFWRLGQSENTHTLYTASKQQVFRVDLQQPPSVTCVLRLHGSDGHITSISSVSDQIFCVLTTKRVFWLDTQSGGPPLMCWNHNREPTDHLQMRWLTFRGICLMNPSNKLLTVYPASLRGAASSLLPIPDTNSIFCPDRPISISLGIPDTSPSLLPRRSLLFFRHPLQPASDACFDVFELTSLSSIYRYRVYPSRNIPDSSLCQSPLSWSSNVQGTRNTTGPTSLYGPLGGQERFTKDMRLWYKRMFYPGGVTSTPPSVTLQLVDDRVAMDDMMTYCDLLSRKLRNPKDPARTNFLMEGCLTASPVASKLEIPRELQWRFSILRTLQSLSPPNFLLPSHLGDTSHARYQVNVPSTEANVLEREDRAAKRLAEDLSMSLEVFSSRSFNLSPYLEGSQTTGGVDEATAMFSRATITADEPPPVRYYYLQPKEDDDDEAGSNVDSQVLSGSEQPLGIRLLLQEWTIGEDPNDYQYVDPYSGETTQGVGGTATSNQGSSKVPLTATQNESPSEIRPAVRSLFLRSGIASQDTHWPGQAVGEPPVPTTWGTQPMETTLPSSSQAIPSTQPVPGRF
ncbi:hypothetical protein FRB99_002050, partial [Tulasnella sp. 403]